MKKRFVLILLAVLLLLSACSNKSGKSAQVDHDLTQLSSTLQYTEVYNMLSKPQDYTGQGVKLTGTFTVYHNEETDHYYFAVLVNDSSACCSQGLEFALKGKRKYPDDYPEIGSTITVQGVFGTYMEDDKMYCELHDAELM